MWERLYLGVWSVYTTQTWKSSLFLVLRLTLYAALTLLLTVTGRERWARSVFALTKLNLCALEEGSFPILLVRRLGLFGLVTMRPRVGMKAFWWRVQL